MSNINNHKIHLSPPHLSGKEIEFLDDATASNWIAPVGPHLDAFEQEFASFTGMQGAAAVQSGTAAIHLALELLGIGRGDRVYCSSFTFIASINPALYLGAEPVFIDAEPDSWNMSPRALRRAMKQDALDGRLPKAVIVVHLYGQSAKMREILRICRHFDVPVIEDAAESLGASYFGVQTGSMGMYGAFSFNGNKIITTSGGGMLVSRSIPAIDRAKKLATQAKEPVPHYEHKEIGYNYRMSNLLAAVGRAQLRQLRIRIKQKRAVFEIYQDALDRVKGFTFMPEYEGSYSTRWLTTLTVDPKFTKVTRDHLIETLAEQNIEARPVWKPLHTQPVFQGVEYHPHSNQTSVSEGLFEQGLCLPSGSALRDVEQQWVINCILARLREERQRFVSISSRR
ncbi:DegT/DnrJ/EryC1/StrS family aminotransferase [Alkalicoccus chagannorensis]|uniref:DegT/DnrJ/EryC1/StrS family aminotransferase n=1 Tax=Alkalicoccus chagannorensis TaxID=427072 RepID=UPI0004049D8E|nr:DegT/DnrJ/EryC1/StrS family aminotransferase [Alkalicoccus chagannorensis]